MNEEESEACMQKCEEYVDALNMRFGFCCVEPAKKRAKTKANPKAKAKALANGSANAPEKNVLEENGGTDGQE